MTDTIASLRKELEGINEAIKFIHNSIHDLEKDAGDTYQNKTRIKEIDSLLRAIVLDPKLAKKEFHKKLDEHKINVLRNL